jgi:hypothetical protein
MAKLGGPLSRLRHQIVRFGKGNAKISASRAIKLMFSVRFRVMRKLKPKTGAVWLMDLNKQLK